MCEYARYPMDMCCREIPICEHTKELCALCVMGNAKTYKEAKEAERKESENDTSK